MSTDAPKVLLVAGEESGDIRGGETGEDGEGFPQRREARLCRPRRQRVAGAHPAVGFDEPVSDAERDAFMAQLRGAGQPKGQGTS